MALTVANRLKPEIYQNKADTLYFEWILDGAKTKPDTSVTVTITQPNGDDMSGTVISDASANIDATTGIISYDLLSTQTTDLGENYIATWTITHDSVVYYSRTYFDIVKYKFEIMIGKDDLVAVEPELNNQEYSTDDDLSDMIIHAHQIIAERIRNKGNRPALILDNTRLIIPHINLVLSVFYNSVSTEPDDVWWLKSEKYQKEFERSFSGFLSMMTYDVDEDGKIQEEKVTMNYNYVRRV